MKEQGKTNQQIEGIGDVVKVILDKTGVEEIYSQYNKFMANKTTNTCTPCEERRRALNESKISKLIFGDKTK